MQTLQRAEGMAKSKKLNGVCIDSSGFIAYLERSFSQKLVKMLPKKAPLLAFDLGDEDDEFAALTTNPVSSGQPTYASEKTESKEYIGLSRKNL